MPDDFRITDVQDIAAEASPPSNMPNVEADANGRRSQPEFLALKSTFTPSRGDMGGGFCVIIEGKTGKTVFQVLWVAKPYATGVIIEPSKDWRTFVKRLPQLGPLDKDWGEKFQEHLKEILTVAEKRKIYENYTKMKLRQLESIIRRNFEAVSQCVFSSVTDAEPIARAELERAKVIKPLPPSPEEAARRKREKEEKERQEKEEKDRREAKKEGNFEGTLIMCTPVLDPVKGKASSSLTPGDIVEVGIEGDGTSALIKKYLEENNVEPCFPIEEIRDTSGKKFLYVKISDEVRGVVTITKDIKIKVKGNKEEETNVAHIAVFSDIFFFGILGLALIILLLVIRYFFIN